MQTTTVPAVSTSQPATPHTRNTGYRIRLDRIGYRGWRPAHHVDTILIPSPRDGQPTCTDRPSNQCPTRYQGNLATGLDCSVVARQQQRHSAFLYYLDRRDPKRS